MQMCIHLSNWECNNGSKITYDDYFRVLYKMNETSANQSQRYVVSLTYSVN